MCLLWLVCGVVVRLLDDRLLLFLYLCISPVVSVECRREWHLAESRYVLFSHSKFIKSRHINSDIKPAPMHRVIKTLNL